MAKILPTASSYPYIEAKLYCQELSTDGRIAESFRKGVAHSQPFPKTLSHRKETS